MKSRWTTRLLLIVVAAVWGVVAWKIFRPVPEVVVPEHAPRPAADTVAVADDTLRFDYPDPFLKNDAREVETLRPVVRELPSPARQVPRERVFFEHTGIVRSGGTTLYIVTVGGEQYELRMREQIGEFVLAAADVDSLYFNKQGLVYGVKRCE